MDKMDRLRRILGSTSSALAALLMVGALAFGSTVIRPMTINHEPDATTARVDDGSAGTDGGSAESGHLFVPARELAGTKDGSDADKEDENYPEWQPKDEPTPEPKEEPKDEPKEQPKEQPKDEPAPAPKGLTLEAFFNADLGKVVIEWSAFTGEFEKYKLVRSKDATVTWPEGEADQLIGVIGPDDQARFVDAEAPCNFELHYRVFAVRHGEEGYVVLGSSNVDGAVRTCEEKEPPPDPIALAFEVAQGEGGVNLAWQACTSDDFVVYKVVRSATNESPKYPLNDGTEQIGVIENAAVTGFTDSNVEAGQTWTYRVLCMGQSGDGWYVIGQTAALAVTVE